MKAKFKVGDKVRILDGSKIEGYMGGYTDSMKKFVGKICTIKEVKIEKDRAGYYMKEVGYIWDERGLAPVNEKIVIYRDDNKVIAKNLATGETAEAKCNPQDAFDFTTGARLAFDRLTGTEKQYIPVVKQEKYEVGDKVLIVSKWVKGCRQNENGKMDKWLGKVMTIRAIKDFEKSYKMEEDEREHNGEGWFWFPPSIVGKVIDENKPEKKPLNTKIVFTKGDDVFKTGHIYEIKDGKIKHPIDEDSLPGFKAKGFDTFYSIEEVKDYFTKNEDRKLHKYGWSDETLEFIEVVND